MRVRTILMLALIAAISVQASSTEDMFLTIKAGGPTPVQDIAVSSQGIIIAAGPRGEAAINRSYIGLYSQNGSVWWASFQGSIKSIASQGGLVVASLSLTGGEAAVLIAHTSNGSAIIARLEALGEPLQGSIRGTTIAGSRIIAVGSVGLGGGPYPRTGLLAVLDSTGHIERAYRLYGLDPAALAQCGSRALIVGETLGGGIAIVETDGRSMFSPRIFRLTGNISLTVIGAHSNGDLAAVTAVAVAPGGRAEPVVVVIDCATHRTAAYVITLPWGVAGLAGKPYVSRSGAILVPINIVAPRTLRVKSILVEIGPSQGGDRPLLAMSSEEAGVYVTRAWAQDGRITVAGGLILPSGEQGFLAVVGVLSGTEQWACSNITITITKAPPISLNMSKIPLAQSSQTQIIIQNASIISQVLSPEGQAPTLASASPTGIPGEATLSTPAATAATSQGRASGGSSGLPAPAPGSPWGEPGRRMVYVMLAGILLLFIGTALLLLPLTREERAK